MINVALGMIQFITIIITAFFEYKHKSLSLFLWGTLLLMFGFPHLLVILFGNSGYSDTVMLEASLFVILFNCIYLITRIMLNKVFGRNVPGWGIFPVATSKSADKRNRRASRLYFSLLCLSFVVLLYYIYKYFGGIAGSSWGAFRGLSVKLGLKSLVRYGTLVFFGSAGVTFVFFRCKKSLTALVGMTIIILYSLLTGNRVTILPALVTVVLLYVYVGDTRLSGRKVAGLGLLAFLSLYVVYFLRLLRILGGFHNMVSNYSFVELNARVIDMLLNGDGELGLRRAFYHFIQYDNNFANFNKGHTYIRLLLIAIPTIVAKDIKPSDFAIDMGSAWSMNPYNTTYSMHPTLYGDCFANLYWFGIFLGILWAVFSCVIDRLISRKKTIAREMLMVLFGTAYVIVGRGSVYNGLFYAFAGTLVVIFVDKVSSVVLKRS